jgi:hypothetical protein
MASNEASRGLLCKILNIQDKTQMKPTKQTDAQEKSLYKLGLDFDGLDSNVQPNFSDSIFASIDI